MADKKIQYLVVRYLDDRPFGEYGLSDKFTVVFSSQNRDKAEQVMEAAELDVEMHNSELDRRIANNVQRLKVEWPTKSTLPFDEEATFDRLKRAYADEYLRCTFSLVEIEMDTYYDRDKEPVLGSSWYIE